MRKLNWDEPLSDEDFAFIRQSGIPGLMERATRHQERFDAEVPEDEIQEDTLTKSALDARARVADQVPEFSQLGAPQMVDFTQQPEEPSSDVDEADEDYDSWSKDDLAAEVDARNALESRQTDVVVTGTGNNGSVLKADLVKGLRLWDQENPGVL